MLASATTACASGSQPLSGRLCSSCGEEAIDPHAQSVRHFVQHTLAHEVLSVDGQLIGGALAMWSL